MLKSPLGQHHLTNDTCTSDLLPKVARIIIVDGSITNRKKATPVPAIAASTMLPKFLLTPPTTVRTAFHDCVSGINTGQQGLIDLILAAS